MGPNRWCWIGLLAMGCGAEGPGPFGEGPSPDQGVPGDLGDAGDVGQGTDAAFDDALVYDAALAPDAGVSPTDASPTEDASAVDSSSPDTGGAPLDAGPGSGTFAFLTYNVAGLPDVLSGSNPRVNTPLISPLLNAYPVVVVQEDFAYHEELVSQVTHPHQSTPLNPPGVNMGDGLNLLSRYPFSGFSREAWVECNGFIDEGSDCLTDKGFSVAELEVAPGVVVDLYNVHLDAGRGQADSDARVAQLTQLSAHLATRPAGRALVIAGDTNLKEEDEAVLLDFLSQHGLTDACRANSCADPGHHDRVMLRSGIGVTLSALAWRLDPTFIDAAGADLSDHPAVAVDLFWSAP